VQNKRLTFARYCVNPKGVLSCPLRQENRDIRPAIFGRLGPRDKRLTHSIAPSSV
jgi:hypothetical protein